MLMVAVGLLLVGFAFKVSAVPFHMWTPDAYEGAPPAVTGFMSTGVKAAAFAAFVRVFLTALEPLHAGWAAVLWPIAAATMIIGTVVGVAQTNVRRMLAYSSVGHGGYLLLALMSGNDYGKGAVLFYLLTAPPPTWARPASSGSSRTTTGRTTRSPTTRVSGTTTRRWPR
jgi:NADH-quinone oxidoreductase subunit N